MDIEEGIGIWVDTVVEVVDNLEPVWDSTGYRPVVHCWDGSCRRLGRETNRGLFSNVMAHTSSPQLFSSKTAGHCTVVP